MDCKVPLVWVLLLILPWFVYGENSCDEGGATPFSSVNISSKMKLLPTTGDISEFVLLEKANQIIYREQTQALFEINVSSGNENRLSRARYPLSHVVKDDESHLATRWYPILFDIGRNHWFSFAGAGAPVEHLYWQGETLYGYQPWLFRQGVQTMRLYGYTLGNTEASSCLYSTDNPFSIARGGRFPHVYIYRSEPAEKGTRVKVFAVDVRDCRREFFSQLNEVVQGPVEAVYVFPNQNSFAIRVKNPQKNLYWRHPKGCAYYKIEDSPLILPNPLQPIVATWSRSEGLSYMDLSKRTKGVFFAGYPITHLLPQHVIGGAKKGVLYLAPLFEKATRRSLIQLELTGAFSATYP